MEKKKFTQSPFDQHFVNVVSYLYKVEKLQQKVFAAELDMPASNLNDILAANRGVPRTKIDFAKFILREKYNVRAEYLETGEGPFLRNPIELNINEHPQIVELMKENELLKIKYQELETRISDLRKLNETQEALINSLREQSSKQGKK